MSIARLINVPLREIWPHEAQDFTVWLSENLDFLGEKLGLDLSLVEREAAAGLFSADILAEDGNGNYVIIENQLEKTDHDHLGKLITYLSNLEAKIAVWITSQPRPEHETAVHWLNEISPVDTAFYLVKIEAVRINESPAAPLITIVAGATPEAKEAGVKKKGLAERHVWRMEFWTQLLNKAREKTLLHANISPAKDNWISTASGYRCCSYNYAIRMKDARVELYIDSGDRVENKRIFDALFAQKVDIEDHFKGHLTWERLDEYRVSLVRYWISTSGLRDQSQWSELQDEMIDAMIRFHNALQPKLKQICR